jgi:hypothetical protein
MRITLTKGDIEDRLHIERADGSRASTVFPHKGPSPHDFVHYAVESELGFDRGFWGLVESGHHPEEVGKMAKASGHPSAKRAEVPAEHFVPAIQAERVVEAFEADHWSGGTGDPAGLISMAAGGCEQSLVPMPPMDEAAVRRIRSRIEDFASRWSALARGESIVLQWGAQA